MLYWLLQSQSAHPDLAQGEVPDGLLAPEERAWLERFTAERRQRDWLLGRWTAKRLLQQVVEQHCGFDVPLDTIVIKTAENDAPFTDFREPYTGRQFSLSISHSQDYALCAVVEGKSVPVGADLEWIEPRDDGFIENFFTEDECELVHRRVRRLHDLHVTAIWSAKEAVLKAAGLGMRVDPRSVSCLVQPVAAEPQDWIPFKVIWRQEQLTGNALPELAGWWQALGGFVLTLATPA